MDSARMNFALVTSWITDPMKPLGDDDLSSSSEEEKKANPVKIGVGPWEAKKPRCGRHIPSNNKWVICTIHQPEGWWHRYRQHGYTHNTAVTDTATEILRKECRRKKLWVIRDDLDLCDERRDLKKRRKERKNTEKLTKGFRRPWRMRMRTGEIPSASTERNN